MYQSLIFCPWGYSFVHMCTTFFFALFLFYLYMTCNNNCDAVTSDGWCSKKCTPRKVSICDRFRSCFTGGCGATGRETYFCSACRSEHLRFHCSPNLEDTCLQSSVSSSRTSLARGLDHEHTAKSVSFIGMSGHCIDDVNCMSCSNKINRCSDCKISCPTATCDRSVHQHVNLSSSLCSHESSHGLCGGTYSGGQDHQDIQKPCNGSCWQLGNGVNHQEDIHESCHGSCGQLDNRMSNEQDIPRSRHWSCGSRGSARLDIPESCHGSCPGLSNRETDQRVISESCRGSCPGLSNRESDQKVISGSCRGSCPGLSNSGSDQKVLSGSCRGSCPGLSNPGSDQKVLSGSCRGSCPGLSNPGSDQKVLSRSCRGSCAGVSNPGSDQKVMSGSCRGSCPAHSNRGRDQKVMSGSCRGSCPAHSNRGSDQKVMSGSCRRSCPAHSNQGSDQKVMSGSCRGSCPGLGNRSAHKVIPDSCCGSHRRQSNRMSDHSFSESRERLGSRGIDCQNVSESRGSSCRQFDSGIDNEQDVLLFSIDDENVDMVDEDVTESLSASPVNGKAISYSSVASCLRESRRNSQKTCSGNEYENLYDDNIDHLTNIQSGQRNRCRPSNSCSSQAMIRKSSCHTCSPSPCSPSPCPSLRCAVKPRQLSSQYSNSEHESSSHSSCGDMDEECNEKSLHESRSPDECEANITNTQIFRMDKCCPLNGCPSEMRISRSISQRSCQPSCEDRIRETSNDQRCQLSNCPCSSFGHSIHDINEDPCRKKSFNSCTKEPDCQPQSRTYHVSECPICRNTLQPQSRRFSFSEVKLQSGDIIPFVQKKCCMSKNKPIFTEACIVHTEVIRPVAERNACL